MLPVLPSTADLQQLTSVRDDASVTIYLPSSPLLRETDHTRMLLKSTVADAARQLARKGVDAERVKEVIGTLEALDDDEEFWTPQARGLAIFAAPGTTRVFRLINNVQHHLAIGDRFDVGVLLRAVSFAHAAYVLTVTEGGIHLYGVSRDEPTRELDLPGLPDDLHSVLEYTIIEDDSAIPRAQGANGEKTEQQRYCRIVQDAVLDRIEDSSLPLILAASRELEPAYRAINRYPQLAEQGIETNPEALTPAKLTERARAVLDGLYREEIAAWGERFERQRNKDRATSDLGHVARAATASAIKELLFDMNSALEGWIGDDGALHLDDSAPSTTYGVIDEIAARVLRSGGTVRAVRAADVPNGSPVAAILRYPF